MSFEIIGLFGFIFGLVAILLSIYFYLKSKKIKKISISIKSFNLLSNTISSLPHFSAKYKDQLLDNLTVSKFHLWNSGTDIIKREDISDLDKLRVEFPKHVQILENRIIKESKIANQSKLDTNSSSQNILTINFDYFSKQQGVVFTLIHTGNIKETPKISGTIKSGNILNNIEKKYSRFKYFFDELLPGILISISLVLVILIANLIVISTWIEWIAGIILFFILGILSISIAEKVKELLKYKIYGELNDIFVKGFSPTEFA